MVGPKPQKNVRIIKQQPLKLGNELQINHAVVQV